MAIPYFAIDTYRIGNLKKKDAVRANELVKNIYSEQGKLIPTIGGDLGSGALKLLNITNADPTERQAEGANEGKAAQGIHEHKAGAGELGRAYGDFLDAWKAYRDDNAGTTEAATKAAMELFINAWAVKVDLASATQVLFQFGGEFLAKNGVDLHPKFKSLTSEFQQTINLLVNQAKPAAETGGAAKGRDSSEGSEAATEMNIRLFLENQDLAGLWRLESLLKCNPEAKGQLETLALDNQTADIATVVASGRFNSIRNKKADTFEVAGLATRNGKLNDKAAKGYALNLVLAELLDSNSSEHKALWNKAYTKLGLNQSVAGRARFILTEPGSSNPGINFVTNTGLVISTSWTAAVTKHIASLVNAHLANNLVDSADPEAVCAAVIGQADTVVFQQEILELLLENVNVELAAGNKKEAFLTSASQFRTDIIPRRNSSNESLERAAPASQALDVLTGGDLKRTAPQRGKALTSALPANASIALFQHLATASWSVTPTAFVASAMTALPILMSMNATTSFASALQANPVLAGVALAFLALTAAALITGSVLQSKNDKSLAFKEGGVFNRAKKDLEAGADTSTTVVVEM